MEAKPTVYFDLIARPEGKGAAPFAFRADVDQWHFFDTFRDMVKFVRSYHARRETLPPTLPILALCACCAGETCERCGGSHMTTIATLSTASASLAVWGAKDIRLVERRREAA